MSLQTPPTSSPRHPAAGRLRRLGAPLLGLALAAAALAVPEPPDEPGDPPATEAPAAEAPAAETPRPRAVVRVNRDEEVMGYVELEDEQLLVLRTHPFGEAKSFLKSRVTRIIRLVDPAPDQKGTVLLRNGQTAEGTVIEDGFDHVVMVVEGIRMRFPREHVEQVTLDPTFEELYAEYKASLGEQISNRHLSLCRWLIDEHRYELAREELLAIIRAKVDSEEARRMLKIVEAQLAMQGPAGPAGEGTTGGAGAEPRRTSGPVDVRNMLPQELVSRNDVNLMRVYEIDFDDPPELSVPADTIRTLLENYGSSNLIPRSADERTAMFRAEPVDIVRLMFDLRARELYPQIQVLSEPPALNVFRQRVHNAWLMNSCATSRCHGGPYAGRLFLHRSNSRDERVRYTNLLILERLQIDEQWPLVNYDVPMDSLIIQHGLPREAARRPHPDVKGWKPVFTRGNQRLLRYSIRWIESMMRPRPQYPIDYEPPRMGDFGTADGRTDR